MAQVCDIIPKVKDKQGNEVDSILFTSLLAKGLKREDAKAVYKEVYGQAFKDANGNWDNFPDEYNGTLDENGEPTIDGLDISTLLFSSSQSNSTQSARKRKGAGIASLEQKSRNSGVVLNKDETAYTDGSNTFARLTEWLDKAFSKLYKDMKLLPHEREAQRMFAQRNLDTKTGKITILDQNKETKEFTYDQLVEHEKMMMNTKGRIYGNIVHAKFHMKVRPSAEIQDKIDRWMKGIPGESYPQNPKDFEWIEGRYREIFREAGMNTFDDGVAPEERDKLLSEFVISSKLLGIATTLDNLFERNNGTYAIIDFKTGGLFSDRGSNIFMRYGRSQSEPIKDNKLNRAKMQVVLQALIVKEQSDDPNLRFSDLIIMHLTKKGLPTKSIIDIKPFLGMIESYYADPANGQLHVYEQLKAKGLLDSNNYMGSNRDLHDDTADMTDEAAADVLAMRVNRLTNEMNAEGVTKQEQLELRLEIEKLTKASQARTGNTISKDTNTTEVESMSWVKRVIGNMNSSANPKIQAFFTLLSSRKTKARARIEALYQQHDKLLKPVIEAYMKTKGVKDTTIRQFTLGGINGLSYTELYDFMWINNDTADIPGKYARIIEAQSDGTFKDKAGNTFSKEQYEYNKWYRETIADQYKTIMGRVAMVRNGKKIARWDMMNMPSELSPEFIPRYMMGMEEVVERNGFFSKATIEYQIDSVVSDFTENQYSGSPVKFGVPIKYMGNKDIIESGNHTLSTELAFKNFVTNLIMKDELDDVYSIGQGLVTMLEDIKDEGRQIYEQDVAFLRDQISLHVLDTKKETKWTRRSFTFKYKGEDHNLSIDRVLRILKSWVSYSSMWLKPVAAGVNAALIFTLSLNKAVVGSIMKRIPGMKPEDYTFTMSSLWFAHKVYGKMMGNSISNVYNKAYGRPEKPDKLAAFAKMMDYLPDNYDYAVRKSDLLGVKNKMFDVGNLYIFHSIGEEYGSYLMLAAQLHHYKMGSKNIWDSYELNAEGELEFVGDREMTMEDGSIVKELTPLEIMSFKRISAQVHGGYRQDERTSLELTALGQWALQFKKYLPNVLENLFQGKYEDYSIGKYVMKTNQNGEDVYAWQGRINEGRVRVLLNFILTMTRLKNDPDYKWDRLPPEQKQRVTELMVSGTMWGMMVGANYLLLGGDDEDDKGLLGIEDKALRKIWRERLERLADDGTQGFAFWDLLKSFENQTTVLPKLYKTAGAVSDLIFDGVIKGKRTQRGDMVGWNTTSAVIPGFTTFNELNRFGVIDFKEDNSLR